MVVTVQAVGLPLSSDTRARIARECRVALEPFRARVVRATLRARRGGEGSARGNVLVQLSVSLGPAGAVRAEARGSLFRSCAETAIRRVAAAVRERLRSEQQELLELLFLVSGPVRAMPAASRVAPERGLRGRRGPSTRVANGKARRSSARLPRAAA